MTRDARDPKPNFQREDVIEKKVAVGHLSKRLGKQTICRCIFKDRRCKGSQTKFPAG